MLLMEVGVFIKWWWFIGHREFKVEEAFVVVIHGCQSYDFHVIGDVIYI